MVLKQQGRRQMSEFNLINENWIKVRKNGSVVSFHSKCKVWGQRTDTVQQFKEPGQRSVPRIF